MDINPIRELLKAAAIVGISPREATLNALDQLSQDEQAWWFEQITGEPHD